jgi:hypothetical protein
MSNITKEWILFAIPLFFFVGVIVAEVFWLVKNNWCSSGKSVAFVLSSNLSSFAIGGFVSFVIMGVMMAMAWDGSINRVWDGDATLWVAVVVMIAFPPVLLVLTKRTLLAMFKIASGKSAWAYSAVSSLIIFIAAIAPAAIFFNLT